MAQAIETTAGAGPSAGIRHDELFALLLDSDRERLPEHLVKHIHAGLEDQALLGAIAEAAARAVSPYPVVGFKYHAFMMMHAVQRTVTQGRDEDRWPSLLWAADVLKASQAAEARQTGGRMDPVAMDRLPAPGQAEDAFVSAMERWRPLPPSLSTETPRRARRWPTFKALGSRQPSKSWPGIDPGPAMHRERLGGGQLVGVVRPDRVDAGKSRLHGRVAEPKTTANLATRAKLIHPEDPATGDMSCRDGNPMHLAPVGVLAVGASY